MVVCMVILMSFYGACERAFHTGTWNEVPMTWLTNIPPNFIMALPFPVSDCRASGAARCSAPPFPRERYWRKNHRHPHFNPSAGCLTAQGRTL